MSDINWQRNAVCYGDGRQWFVNTGFESGKFELVNNDGSRKYSLYGILNFPKDFQLNEIKVGDYLHKSELDTEQKYNDVVEVFGLFGFNGFMTVTDYSAAMGDVFKLIYIKDTRFMMCNKHANLNRQLTYSQIIAIGKLKRMMLDKVEAKLIDHQTLGNKVTANKYEREITGRQGNSATVDVYDVLKAFEVTCPATQHAVKKLLCSGLRGHKNLQTDLIEAKESIVRAIELN